MEINMKKAIIAIAVLLVISIFATVGFGVALGTQGIKSLYNNAEIQRSFSEFKQHFNDSSEEEQETVTENKETNNAPREVIESGTVAKQNSEKYPLPVAERSVALPMDNIEKLVINANVGDVNIYTLPKGKPYIKMNLYSADKNIEGRNGYKYEIVRIGSTLEVNLDSTANRSEDNDMTVNVFLPNNMAEKNLEVNVAKGDVTADKINPKKIALNVQLGNVMFVDVISDVLEATVATGNIVLGMGTRILESIDVNIKTGDFKLCFPEDLGFTLDLDDVASAAGNIADFFTNAFKTLVDGKVQYKDGKVKLDVDVGGLFELLPDASVTVQ